MDLNDINARIDRIYISIGLLARGASKLDINKRVTKFIDGDGRNVERTEYLLNEDGASEVLVNAVIDNLAHLKDPLKKKMESMGKEPQLIEDEINASFNLCLLIDLANAAKHGYPLKKHKRSGVDPRLFDVRKVFVYTVKDPTATGFNIIEADGSIGNELQPRIFAQIVNADGQNIMIIDDLVDGCCYDWENIISKYGLR